MNRRSLSTYLWFCPALFFLAGLHFLAPMALWGIFIVAVLSALYGLALLTSPISAPAITLGTPTQPIPFSSAPSTDGLPRVPGTLNEVRLMSPTEFEIFSAAVLIGMGRGYRFYQHCGGSGDQGVDAKLRNGFDQIIAVQSKLYADNNTVESSELRDFAGAIPFHKAAYGYFVTTSTFSRGAQQVIANSRIHPIDGRQLEALLRLRSREIALTWQEIQEILKQQPL